MIKNYTRNLKKPFQISNKILNDNFENAVIIEELIFQKESYLISI